MKGYNPHAVRRNVRHQFTTADGIATAVTKSFTREDDDRDLYHPSVDVCTGAVHCDCPHYRYRLAEAGGHVSKPETMCKHIVRFVENLTRKGELVIEAACEVREEKSEAAPLPEYNSPEYWALANSF